MTDPDSGVRVGAAVDLLKQAGASLEATVSSLQQSAWVPTKRWSMAHGDRYFPLIGALLFVMSIAFPYWKLQLNAPQYPDGLHVTLGVNTIGGDAQEIDGLNHYIGMRPLSEGGKFERSIAVYAVVAMALLTTMAAVRRKWFWLAALPGILFPPVFTADLFYWLYTFGHNLDPRAALSNAFDDFMPTLLGPGRVGQFTTWSFYDLGFGMSFMASLLLIAAVIIRIQRERRQV